MSDYSNEQPSLQRPEYLNYNEVLAIIAAVEEVSKRPERDTLLVETLWQSGGRVSEVVMLKPEQVGEDSLILQNLQQSKNKKEREKQEVFYKQVEVKPDLCTRLKEYCVEHGVPEGTPVFRGNTPRTYGRSLDPLYVWRLITKVSKGLDIQKMKRGDGSFKPAWTHLLRHSCGQHILDETGSVKLVQQQLGHASIISSLLYTIGQGNIEEV